MTRCLRHRHGRYDFNDAVLPVGAAYWVQLVANALPVSGRTNQQAKQTSE